MKNIFIIGSKGIPAQYGGFETFVDKLVSGKQRKTIKYHVACMSDTFMETEYKGARCFHIKVPSIGPAKAVYYDILAFWNCIQYIKKDKIENPIIYILACRIGPFMYFLKKRLKKYKGRVYVNPDGHEWLRGKWNWLIKKYWKFSEQLMVKHADLLICDSKNIENYIQREYKKYNPKTRFIAYGSDIEKSTLSDENEKLLSWYRKNKVRPFAYYLVVGRFVPENNYETMLREFMKSKTAKDFVLISNIEKNKFYEKLKENTHFDQDKRIKFVGTVYDAELLKKIREQAFAYFHGHEVGGTNPSLLEALGSTKLNLLLDVGFNREVAEDGAIYWNKDMDSLKNRMEQVEGLEEVQIQELEQKAKKRIADQYSWAHIIEEYEQVWGNER